MSDAYAIGEHDRMIAAMLMQAAVAAPTLDPALPTAVAAARAVVSGPARDLWQDWDGAPFGVLIVQPQIETLFCHLGPAATFTPGPAAPATGCATAWRARATSPPRSPSRVST